MVLSILIATILERKKQFNLLREEFCRQIGDLPVELLWEQDNKEISVGEKRQKLLSRSKGLYIVYFDDDDFPEPYYVSEIISALQTEPDCLGYLILMTTNGVNEQICCHSIRYPEWKTKVDGYDYVRNCSHFNVIKRELAAQIGFQDKRFGEDRPYSDDVTKLCRTEVFINKIMFRYRYSNKISHRKKYGIR